MENRYPDHERWVLEWSHKSNNLHVQPLAAALAFNMSRFFLNARTPGDYVVVLVGTYAEVTAKADEIRPRVVSREQDRVVATL